MSKIIKKVTGVVLMIALLVTTAGTSAKAEKRVQWPYGTYKCTNKGFTDLRLEWEFGDGENGYDNFIYIRSTMNPKDEIMETHYMKEVGKNRYRTKVTKYQGKKSYQEIKVKKNSLVLKYVLGKSVSKDNYKIQKRLPKNVG